VFLEGRGKLVWYLEFGMYINFPNPASGVF